MCLPVEWNSEEEGSLGRREEGRALWCLPFFGWWCWLLCRVCQWAGGASERASRARPRMREICFFCERDNRRIQKDPQTPNTHPESWCVFSWQRKWLGVCVSTARDLCSLKCGTSRVGTTRKWQTCWCKNSVDYYSALEQSFLWIQGYESQVKSFTWHYFFHEAKLTHLSIGTFWSD
jgi:hypothetical protein